jgi:hypothetical protein
MEYVDVDGWTILKWMLEEEDVGRINLAHKIVIDVHLATQK